MVSVNSGPQRGQSQPGMSPSRMAPNGLVMLGKDGNVIGIDEVAVSHRMSRPLCELEQIVLGSWTSCRISCDTS